MKKAKAEIPCTCLLYTSETKKIFGFVSDTPDNFLRLRAIEYLNFIADVYGVSKEERKQRISEMAERFQIRCV